jgi:hypothetical protein
VWPGLPMWIRSRSLKLTKPGDIWLKYSPLRREVESKARSIA